MTVVSQVNTQGLTQGGVANQQNCGSQFKFFAADNLIDIKSYGMNVYPMSQNAAYPKATEVMRRKRIQDDRKWWSRLTGR